MRVFFVLIFVTTLQILLIMTLSTTTQDYVLHTFRSLWNRDHGRRLYTNKTLNLMAMEIHNMTNSNPVFTDLINDTIAASRWSDSSSLLKRVDVLFLVTSGPGRVQRRNAIRKSWWKECLPTQDVRLSKAFFYTHRL